MLTTSKADALKYDYLSKHFRTAFEFLNRTGLETLEPGSYPLDNNEVVAHIQHYETEDPAKLQYETHDQYFDIQYLISGTEAFGYAKRSDLIESIPYDSDKDITFYKAPKSDSTIILTPGDFATVAPEDAHRPRGMVSTPELVKKVVVKIKI